MPQHHTPIEQELARITPGHSELLIASYKRWTGRDLLPAPVQDAREALYLFQNPVLSHGTQADPILNYGNRTTMALWEMDWSQLTSTPSRLTAEPQNRAARQQLLDEVLRQGYTDNYSGVRISRTGKRFLIRRATVWTVVDDSGALRGQAATFDSWEPLV